jgi:hypothetical protein
MKMYSFVLLATAFTTMAVYGEPIDLGCNARGPLAALQGSAALRKAIGDANAANFLGSVYDVNGQRLSPGSYKHLQCPLFIDSSAEPSAAASKAILRAEAGIRAEEPEQQASTAAGQITPILVLGASGVVAQFPQPETRNAEPQEKPQAARNADAGRTEKRRDATAVSDLALDNQQLQPETSKPRQEMMVQALAVPGPKQVDGPREQNSSSVQSQKSLFLSFAESTGLIRHARTGDSEASLEFNPVMVLFDFLALFSAVLAFSLLVFHPGFRTPEVHSRADVYRAVLNSIDLEMQPPVHMTTRRAPSVQTPASPLMFPVAH